jgi:hypothetical protein
MEVEIVIVHALRKTVTLIIPAIQHPHLHLNQPMNLRLGTPAIEALVMEVKTVTPATRVVRVVVRGVVLAKIVEKVKRINEVNLTLGWCRSHSIYERRLRG